MRYFSILFCLNSTLLLAAGQENRDANVTWRGDGNEAPNLYDRTQNKKLDEQLRDDYPDNSQGYYYNQGYPYQQDQYQNSNSNQRSNNRWNLRQPFEDE
jgi:hypothetical protein